MSEYVPPTGLVQDAYCHVQQEIMDERGDAAHEKFHAEFDRWLAAHDAEVAAEAVGGFRAYVAAEIDDYLSIPALHVLADDYLRARAAEYRKAVQGEHHEPVQLECLDHEPVQHRDGKQPWCRVCGLDARGNEPESRLGRHVQAEPNGDREALIREALEQVREIAEAGRAGEPLRSIPKDADPNWGWLQTMWPVAVAVDVVLSRATVPDAATELAEIKARAEEVGEDEGWHIGGAWGDYGEVVVPLRILSYVVDGALDEKIVSTDPGYAATYAEQVSRAEQAEAERDAALARIAEAAKLHRRWNRGGDDVCMHCKQDTSPMPEPVRWPCPTAVSLGLNEGENGVS